MRGVTIFYHSYGLLLVGTENYATAMPSGGLSRPALLSEHPARGIQNRARNDSTLFSLRNCIFTTLTLRENKIRWSF